MDQTPHSTPNAQRILLVTGVGDCTKATEEAFRAASATGAEIALLQILTSDLYHYGHNDLVATRPSKAQFLLYIREQVLERAAAQAADLRKRALDTGITLSVRPVETEDVAAAVIAEAKNGYDRIFLPRERKKLFPLLKRPIIRSLGKELRSRVVEC
jgi:hypothetical protein